MDGIFCPNESTTFGMLLALEKAKLAGKVKFFGFDSSEKLVGGLNDEKIHGLVLQACLQAHAMGFSRVALTNAHLEPGHIATLRAVAKEFEVRTGQVLAFEYEPDVLVCAGGTKYRPDFRVTLADGAQQYHEVKGFWRKSDRVRVREAAQRRCARGIDAIPAIDQRERRRRIT